MKSARPKHRSLASRRRLPLVFLTFAFAAFLASGCDDSESSPTEDVMNDAAVDTLEDTAQPDTDTSPQEDTDEPDTGPDPFADSDEDGLADYLEDLNGNGMVDIGETDPANPDTDNDGLPDGVEDANANGRLDLGETSPLNPDTDEDTLLDGLEDLNANGLFEPEEGETDPLSPDSDNDGLTDAVEINSDLDLDPNNPDTDADNLADGVEDRNQNGVYEPDMGETDPTALDTDGDGMLDGCEDRDSSGDVNIGETDPRVADTDGDSLADGEECIALPKGACPDFNNVGNCATDPTRADTDGDGLSDYVELRSDYGGGINSDPRKEDTDGDGVPDGLEDFNQNGRYDPQLGELNPIDPMTDGSTPDAQRPQAQACLSKDAPAIVELPDADIKFAYNAELMAAELGFGAGAPANMAGYAFDHPTQPIAGFVLSKPASAGATTALEQEQADAASIGGQAFFPRTLETWDGYEGRTTTYRVGTGGDTVSLRNTVVAGLSNVSQSIVSGLPVGGGTAATKFTVTVTTIYRGADQVVLIGAVLPDDGTPPDAANARMLSLTSATGLAEMDDALRTNENGDLQKACNIYRVTELPIVDFLFVVDDTGSMNPIQDEVIAAADQLFDAIQSAFISARWTVASTEVDTEGGVNGGTTHCGLTSAPKGPNGNIWAQFSDDAAQGFSCKIADPIGTEACPAAITSGRNYGAYEYGLTCAKWAIDYIQGRRGTLVPEHLQRPRSELIVIIITDEYEQFTSNTTGMSSADAAAMQNWLGAGVPNSPATVGARFAEYFQNEASVPPYGQATPFLIYDVNSSTDKRGYAQLILENPDPNAFPNSAVQDIQELDQIGPFIDSVIRAANGLASKFEPAYTPITANMKVVVQRAFTTDSLELDHSQINGWHYDAAAGSMLFFGPDRPVLLDSFAINYAYWVTPTAGGDDDDTEMPAP